MTPNDPYKGRTAPLTSKDAFYYIYSTNIGTEYFKHGIYSPFFPLQYSVCFIILTYLVPVLFTFYIQDVLKLKKKIGAKSLREGRRPQLEHVTDGMTDVVGRTASSPNNAIPNSVPCATSTAQRDR